MYPLARTLRSIPRARLFGLMLAAVALALVLVLSAVTGVSVLTASLAGTDSWLGKVLVGTVSVLAGVGGWFLLPVLTILVGGLFQEWVVQRVEQAEYPSSKWGGAPGWLQNLPHDLRFTLLALFLNLLVLPFYLLGVGFLMSIALNSYLLGREFFENVAGLHLGKPEARALGRRNRGTVYGGGLVITLATLTPILNLFVPILASVWMVHVFQRLSGDSNLQPAEKSV